MLSAFSFNYFFALFFFIQRTIFRFLWVFFVDLQLKKDLKEIKVMEEQIREKQTAPNSVAALVLGIASIVFGCAIVGLVCGIIGLIYANKGLKEYNQNPQLYNGNGMLNAGKITSIIGIIFGGLALLYIIFVVGIAGLFAAGYSEFY